VRFVLGITGASGAIYAARFLQHMQALGHLVDVVVSTSGQQVLDFEKQSDCLALAARQFSNDDFFAAPASGSAHYAGMLIAPCSMGTLGRIAAGISDSLLARAADVCLKERRPLVVLPREMPFSRIHLENMLRLQDAGATIIAASPSFYRNPTTIEELVDSVLAKVFDHLHVAHQLVKPWGEEPNT